MPMAEATRRLVAASATEQAARDRAHAAVGELTDRETDVRIPPGEGMSNAQIAARLYLSEATVKGHVSRMLTKLHCANRTQAGLVAHDARWSRTEPDEHPCSADAGKRPDRSARPARLVPAEGSLNGLWTIVCNAASW